MDDDAQFAGMAKFADVAYKSVTAGLGLATLWVGGNLVFNITRGISWHYAQEKVLLFSSLCSEFDSFMVSRVTTLKDLLLLSL